MRRMLVDHRRKWRHGSMRVELQQRNPHTILHLHQLLEVMCIALPSAALAGDEKYGVDRVWKVRVEDVPIKDQLRAGSSGAFISAICANLPARKCLEFSITLIVFNSCFGQHSQTLFLF